MSLDTSLACGLAIAGVESDRPRAEDVGRSLAKAFRRDRMRFNDGRRRSLEGTKPTRGTHPKHTHPKGRPTLMKRGRL